MKKPLTIEDVNNNKWDVEDCIRYFNPDWDANDEKLMQWFIDGVFPSKTLPIEEYIKILNYEFIYSKQK